MKNLESNKIKNIYQVWINYIKNISMKIYIRNPKIGMYGVIIDDKKYSHTKMSMIVREKLPLKSDFEIC